MGMFSWILQDTHERIVAGKHMHVVMTDDKNNHWVEECYEGYGVFGGKDFYELLAEMNGYKVMELKGCGFVVIDKDGKEHAFDKAEHKTDWVRQKGIEMAFDGHPHGDNPNLKWPSLTTRGWYCNGECPESDPDQGFPMDEFEDEEYNEEEAW